MGNVEEQRIRRMAERQGLELVKSRRRDPHALDFGRFALLNRHGTPVFGRPRYGGLNAATLEDCERYLEAGAEYGAEYTAEFTTLILSVSEVMERWGMDTDAARRILGYHPLDDFDCMVDGHGNLYWTVEKVQDAESAYGDLIAAKDWDGFVRRSAKEYRRERADLHTDDTVRGFQSGENVNNRPPVVRL